MANAKKNIAFLSLADESRWAVEGGDQQGSTVALRLKEIMRMQSYISSAHRLIILVNNQSGKAGDGIPIVRNTGCSALLSNTGFETIRLATDEIMNNQRLTVIEVDSPVDTSDSLAYYLWQVSMVVAHQVQINGGFLIHGALAEWNGHGIVMAGPSAGGKTTASKRLFPPWRSLSDDCTLVVRDKQGVYFAHPWPTWSSFMFGGQGGAWDVQYAVPLKGVFFLKQVLEDKVEQINKARAVCMLVESVEQVSVPCS
jgi:SynChlorMet cassette protein ScmC